MTLSWHSICIALHCHLSSLL